MKLRNIFLIVGLLLSSQVYAAKTDDCTFTIYNDVPSSAWGVPADFKLVEVTNPDKYHWATNVLPPNGSITFTMEPKFCFMGVLSPVTFAFQWKDNDPKHPYHVVTYKDNVDTRYKKLSEFRMMHGIENWSTEPHIPIVPINP